jgi:hypothetical protein
MYYSMALFIHIVGAIGMFVMLGVEWLTLAHLQRAPSVESVREWLGVVGSVRRVGGVSMLAIVVAGFYMMAVAQIDAAWLMVAVGALVALIVLGTVLTARRMKAIGRAMTAPGGPISPALDAALHHPLLVVALRLRVAVVLGIVFLMTVKPDLSGSLLTMGVALVAGLVAALPAISSTPARTQSTT